MNCSLQDIDYVSTILEKIPNWKISTPFETNTGITFTSFGIRVAGDIFSKGWNVICPSNSNARFLLAFHTGSLRYESGSNRLLLEMVDPFGTALRKEFIPKWFPIPKYIIYENIDEFQTLQIIKDYLMDNPKITKSLNNQFSNTQTIDDLVEKFKTNQLPRGLPIKSHEKIGVAGNSSNNTEKEFSFFMQEELDNAEGLFLDPAIYHVHWEKYFINLLNHPLKEELQRIFAGPISNSTIRYVQKGNTSTTGQFTDYQNPARSIQDALNISNPYDTIIIMDSSDYRISLEIQISKPINITSLFTEDVKLNNIPNLPSLNGHNSSRIINIEEPEGIVSISNVVIKNGNVEIFQISGLTSFFPYAGGGILINKADETYIRNCVIRNNTTINEGYFSERGFGGGICTYHSSAFIFHNRITDNTSASRGGGIGVFGYGWPVITDNIIKNNQTVDTDRGDGGGIGIVIAYPNNLISVDTINILSLTSNSWITAELDSARFRQVLIIRNIIEGNQARDDGGGIYMSVLSRVKCIDNTIQYNTASNAGGGIRCTMGSELQMRGDHIEYNIANTNNSTNGGGGIASRNSNVDLVDVVIQENITCGFAGGGVYYNSTDAGKILGVYKWDKILRDVFNSKEFFLKICDNTAIQNNIVTLHQNSTKDTRKGGGVYVLRTKADWHDITINDGLPISVTFGNINLINNNQQDENLNLFPLNQEMKDSKNIHVEDKVHLSIPINLSNQTNHINGSEFHYESN